MMKIWPFIFAFFCTAAIADTQSKPLADQKTVKQVATYAQIDSAASESQPTSTKTLYDTSPDVRLLRYEITNPLVSHLGSISLELYGDGRMVVVRPTYLKQPGTYEAQLSDSEISGLLASLLDAGITAAVAPQPKQNDKPEEHFLIADGDQVSIEFQLLEQKNSGQLTAISGETTQEAPLVRANLPSAGITTKALARTDALLRPRAMNIGSMIKLESDNE